MENLNFKQNGFHFHSLKMNYDFIIELMVQNWFHSLAELASVTLYLLNNYCQKVFYIHLFSKWALASPGCAELTTGQPRYHTPRSRHVLLYRCIVLTFLYWSMPSPGQVQAAATAFSCLARAHMTSTPPKTTPGVEVHFKQLDKTPFLRTGNSLKTNWRLHWRQFVLIQHKYYWLSHDTFVSHKNKSHW